MNGILGARRSARGRGSRRQSLGSLGNFGALGATIPAKCWDVAGFKDCNTQSWKVAQKKCITDGLAQQQYGGDWEKCQAEQAADYTYFGCALRLCPPAPPEHPTSSGGWTWMSKTPNQSVLTFQQHLNTALTSAGFKTITADGKLGPSTCGAFNFVGGLFPDLFKNDPIENIGVCQSFTNPTKVGGSRPEPSPTSEEGRLLDLKFGGLPWMQQDDRAPALQRNINKELDSNEMLPIAISGQLDAPMCGAMDFLDRETGTRWHDSWGPIGLDRCPAYVAPRRRPSAPAPSPVTPVPVPIGPPIVPPGPAPAPAIASASLLGGGILLALGAGAYLYYKHKTGGA